MNSFYFIWLFNKVKFLVSGIKKIFKPVQKYVHRHSIFFPFETRTK